MILDEARINRECCIDMRLQEGQLAGRDCLSSEDSRVYLSLFSGLELVVVLPKMCMYHQGNKPEQLHRLGGQRGLDHAGHVIQSDSFRHGWRWYDGGNADGAGGAL